MIMKNAANANVEFFILFLEAHLLQQQAAGSCFHRPRGKAAKHLLFMVDSESYRCGRDIRRSITVWMFHIHIPLKGRRWKRTNLLRFLSLLPLVAADDVSERPADFLCFLFVS